MQTPVLRIAQSDHNRNSSPLDLFAAFWAAVFIFSAYVLSIFAETTRLCLVFASISIVVSLLQTIAKKRWFPHYFFLPWLFLGFNAASIGWASDTEMAIDGVGMTVTPVLGAMGVWLALSNGMSWKVVVWVSMLSILPLVASSWTQVQDFGVTGRAAGILGNSNSLAIWLAFVAFTVWLSPTTSPRWMRVLSAIFVVYSFLVSGSRKSVIILLIGILGILWWSVRKMNRLSAWIFLAFGGVIVSLGVLIFLSQIHQMMEIIQSSGTFRRTMATFDDNIREDSRDDRTDMIITAIQMWKESPIIGRGADQFAVLSGFGCYAHNNYVELLANLGLIGFCLYYSFHALLLMRAVRGARSGNSERRSAVILLLLILCIDIGMVSYYASKVSWLILGLAADLATSSRGDATASRCNLTVSVSR